MTKDIGSRASDGEFPTPSDFAIDNPVLIAMAAVDARYRIQAIGKLDRALAKIVDTKSSEDVIFAQLKLAWWRDELGQLCDDRHRPDPVLAALAQEADLALCSRAVALANAYEEQLLAPTEPTNAILETLRKRGMALAELVSHAVGEGLNPDHRAGSIAALVEYGLRGRNLALQTAIRHAVARTEIEPTTPKILRAFDGWALRIAKRDGFETRAIDQMYLLRIGLIGR